jgi:sortase A
MNRLRGLSSVLIVVGALLVLDAALAVVWQEPVSALYTSIRQQLLEEELERANPTAGELRTARKLPSRERLAFLARSLRKRSRPGEPLGKIRIPDLDVDWVLVEGADRASLRKGPAHYPDTPLPGSRGTVGVAGHRTTYGAPFRDVDRLRTGDRVVLRMPYAKFLYRVRRSQIVAPQAVEVLRRRGRDQVVLSACHPKYSAAKRLVVFATLDRIEPVDRRRSFLDRVLEAA